MSFILLLIAKIYMAIVIAAAALIALIGVACLKIVMVLWLSLRYACDFVKFTNVSRP